MFLRTAIFRTVRIFLAHFTKTGQSAAIRALRETEAIEIIKTVFCLIRRYLV